MTPIRISGKNLGQLALKDFCPRCFWLRLHCDGKLPFQVFPGIFSSIDTFSKRVTGAHFAKHAKAPAWLSELGGQELVPVPSLSKFRVMEEASGVLLTGQPDEILRKADRTLIVLDYKTSRFTANQDALLPLYAIQLNAYAYIAQRIGLGTVSGLALVYYEPVAQVGVGDIDTVAGTDGFRMRFVAKVLPVTLEPDKIPPLLARVREIYDLPVAPTGRVGCKDCALLDNLMEIATP